MQEEDQQKIEIKERKSGEISGVREVISFDESSIVLDTVTGKLTVEGEELTVNSLDTDGGRVSFSGVISGLFYTDSVPEKRGFFKRMFT